MAALLDIRNLVAGYGRNQVLHGVSLDVGDGEIVFAGEAIAALPTAAIVRRGIALVPERRQLFGAMSVEEKEAYATGKLEVLDGGKGEAPEKTADGKK